MLKYNKINESFGYLEGQPSEITKAFNKLKIFDASSRHDRLCKIGIKSPYKCFGSIQQGKLLIYNGHVSILRDMIENVPEPDNSMILDFAKNHFKDILDKLPFKPYDYQINAVKNALKYKKCLNRACTSSGKSLVISIILEYFRRKGLKGVLVVPNINLLTQFKSDIESYNLSDLYNDIEIHGDDSKSTFSKTLTISTWQSLVDENKTNFDFIVVDECHRFASEVVSDILQRADKTSIKLGFTGTLPEDPVAKMTLYGLFGQEFNVISAKELISRGLGCPVNIKSVIFNYTNTEKCAFRQLSEYNDQLEFLINHEHRNSMIVKITCSLFKKGENCLVLFQRTLHGKQLFVDIMNKLYPDVEVQEENIVGKKSLDFQRKYNVYFLNGEQPSKIREAVRNILNESTDAILISNYSLLSTGVNIKPLKNMILASPLKAFITVSQSIGRLMRLHKSKDHADVYDIVDNFGIKKPSGIFWKQYQHRIESSYKPEEFPVQEVFINI